MPSHRTGELLLAETAASAGSCAGRAQALLRALRPLVPFAGAWLAVTDPVAGNYRTLASEGIDDAAAEYLTSPLMAHDMASAGDDVAGVPGHATVGPGWPGLSRRSPAMRVATWPVRSGPDAVQQALAVSLVAPPGRLVGLLAVLPPPEQPPSALDHHRLGRLAPVLARGIDPMRSLLTAARLVRDATAGVVIRTDGTCESLPGLAGDALLTPSDPLLVTALHRIADGQVFTCFLWPRGGRHAPDGHARVTVLTAPDDVPPGWRGVVLLSPSVDRHGLTPRELDVLGLVVEGCSNREIAHALVVAPRTVATHLEHVMAKLGTPTRTLAAVHADRAGLYVPAVRR